MTPYKHAQSSQVAWGGIPEDYIDLHNWFDETKQYTGDWSHRALRHHAAGVEWAVQKFGHWLTLQNGNRVPTKLIAEQHITEDCGFIPKVSDWLAPLVKNPDKWMLRVGTINVTTTLETK